jgi:uncharacterized damage-inducible protein DinB
MGLCLCCGGAAMTQPQQEAWLRGPVEGFDPLVMPIVHALIQVREDVARLARDVPLAQIWERPGGAASIGFHVRHIGGALDRLFTYARGETLSEAQRAALRIEEAPGDPPQTLDVLSGALAAGIDRAFEQLRATSRRDLEVARAVGRAGLPSTVLGLLFHAAEHSTRHSGQAITTARILSNSE